MSVSTEFSTIYNIVSTQKSDQLYFTAVQETPFEVTLRITDIDENILANKLPDGFDNNDNLFWLIDIDSGNGFSSVKTYYRVEINDFETHGYSSKLFVIYVTDDLEFQNKIIRSLGISGFNIRKFDYVWEKGLLTQFDAKIYSTKEKIESAENGDSDDFIAHYRTEITYNEQFNPTQIKNSRIS